MATEAKERKSTPYNQNEICPECDSENVYRTGGVSADYFICGRLEGVDVSDFKCGDCNSEWSD